METVKVGKNFQLTGEGEKEMIIMMIVMTTTTINQSRELMLSNRPSPS